jgi:hypothetical protein
MIVDRFLGGRRRVWAIVAAFGDGLTEAAQALAAPLELDATRLAQLRELGEGLAYNAYGDAETDLIVAPAALYRLLSGYADPFRFIRQEQPAQILAARRRSRTGARWSRSWRRTRSPSPCCPTRPDRRVRGSSNELARSAAQRAHAVHARAGWRLCRAFARHRRSPPALTRLRQFATAAGGTRRNQSPAGRNVAGVRAEVRGDLCLIHRSLPRPRYCAAAVNHCVSR